MSITKTCSVEKCERKHAAKGLCKLHHGRYRLYGVPALYKYEKHGMGSRVNRRSEYTAWHTMKQRCYDVRNKRYQSYGGRGIRVCDEWKSSFRAFYSFMGSRPSAEHSLDRINVDGNYEPGNVRWATRSEQANNTTKNRYVEVGTLRKTMAEWSRVTGVHEETIRRRLNRGLQGYAAVKPSNPRYLQKSKLPPL